MRTALFVALIGAVALACGGSTTSIPDGTDGGRSSSSSSSSSSSGGASSSSSSSSGATSSSSSSGSVDAGGGCTPACSAGRQCCAGVCVNTANDPLNCGSCGTKCTGETSYCDGTCTTPPCANGSHCGVGTTCCGDQCCTSGELCCATEGPISGAPTCFKPTDTQKTCPQGCAPMCVSDRDAKHDFQAVDPRAVLDEVARLPMSTWSYKSDPKGTRHLGPMAQDFKQELQLGGSDRSYDPIDAHGAALTSIQALYTMVQEQNARIKALEDENRALRRRLDATPKASGR